MFWNWHEFRTMNSMKEMNDVTATLHKEHIPYKVKTNTRLGATRSRMGTSGMKNDTYYEYRIFIKKEDLEKATSLI